MIEKPRFLEAARKCAAGDHEPSFGPVLMCKWCGEYLTLQENSIPASSIIAPANDTSPRGQDNVKITEEWIRFRGIIYLVWNGELVGTWPEAEAPIGFVQALERVHGSEA